MPAVWIDALTPKQLLLGYGILVELSKKNFSHVLTTRKGSYVDYITRRLGIKPLVVGEYGKTLAEKLLRDLERSRELATVRDVVETGVLVSYPSPSAVRTAFGLSKKIIILTDTPHATHAHRLTVPLADVVVSSSFMEPGELDKYTLRYFTRTLTFAGVDELAWINRIKPNAKIAGELGLEEEYIIARPPERYASYFPEYGGNLDFRMLVQELSKYHQVVIIPRYDDDIKVYKGIKNVLIVESTLTLDLLPKAKLVVTGGATMAREAALLGVPSIYTFYTEMSVNKRLRELGFPIFHARTLENALRLARSLVEREVKHNVEKLRKKLEDPVPLVVKLVSGFLAG